METLLEKFPEVKTPQRLLSLGQIRLQAGNTEGALKAARDSAALDPEELVVQNFIGMVLGPTRQERRGDRPLQGPDRYAAPTTTRPSKVARSGLSNVYVNMDEFDKGEAELEILLAKEPDDAGVNNDLGYLYADRGKDLEKAEAMIRKALDEEPDNAAYLDSLGWVLFKRGKVQEAVEPLEKAARAPSTDATDLRPPGRRLLPAPGATPRPRPRGRRPRRSPTSRPRPTSASPRSARSSRRWEGLQGPQGRHGREPLSDRDWPRAAADPARGRPPASASPADRVHASAAQEPEGSWQGILIRPTSRTARGPSTPSGASSSASSAAPSSSPPATAAATPT